MKRAKGDMAKKTVNVKSHVRRQSEEAALWHNKGDAKAKAHKRSQPRRK